MQISTSPNYLHFESRNENENVNENAKIVMITRVGIEVRVDCWAPFPINIEFDGHLVRKDLKMKPPPLSKSHRVQWFFISIVVLTDDFDF